MTTITTLSHHTEAGSLREGPLPSAEIDAAGTVYVVWADCRFRTRCRGTTSSSVHSTNATGTTWSSVARVPIDATTSTVDHFIPGLAVNKGTSGSTAQLGVYLLLLHRYRLRPQLPAQRRLHLLDQRRQHVERRDGDRRSLQRHLGGQHQPGAHGRRLHLDLLWLG